MTELTLDTETEHMLLDVLQSCVLAGAPVDAVSYRADREDWLDKLSELESRQYLKRENDCYRVAFVVLTLLKKDEALIELERCRHAFEILRDHYKEPFSRGQTLSIHDVAEFICVTDNEAAQTMAYLMDASALWFGGGGNFDSDDQTATYFIPSESILKCKTFDDFMSKVQAWFVQSGMPPNSYDSFFGGESDDAPRVRRELHPWPIVSSFVGELDPDVLVKIIGRSGLRIDLVLPKEQAYSAKTRRREYIPRVNAAVDELSEEDGILATRNLARELIRHEASLEQSLNEALVKIGWKIAGGELTTDSEKLREAFFPAGAEHTAYVEIRRILQRATQSIDIIDGYLNGTIFSMLGTLEGKSLRVQLLTAKPPKDFKLEAEKFAKEFPSFGLEIKITREFHDRFIVLDGSSCYHIGASIKDAGKSAFLISQLEDTEIVTSLTSFIAAKWQAALSI
jgi:hypothetical protein